MRFRKKPVEIEAMQFVKDGHGASNIRALAEWITSNGGEVVERPPYALGIVTMEGTMAAVPGDWIIRGVKGEFYPCKPDIFEASYEPVGRS